MQCLIIRMRFKVDYLYEIYNFYYIYFKLIQNIRYQCHHSCFKSQKHCSCHSEWGRGAEFHFAQAFKKGMGEGLGVLRLDCEVEIPCDGYRRLQTQTLGKAWTKNSCLLMRFSCCLKREILWVDFTAGRAYFQISFWRRHGVGSGLSARGGDSCPRGGVHGMPDHHRGYQRRERAWRPVVALGILLGAQNQGSSENLCK